MTATVHALPAADICPNCDGAMTNRRGEYHCGYCGRWFRRDGTATLTSTTGAVTSSVRVWIRERKEASDAT